MIQMDMIFTFKKVIILIFEYYMCNHLQTFPNLCENLYLMYLMPFFNLEVLKGKPTKFLGIMPHLKLSKKCF